MAKQAKKLTKAEAGRLGGMTTKKRTASSTTGAAGKKGFMAPSPGIGRGQVELHPLPARMRWLSEVLSALRGAAVRPDGIKSIELPLLPGELDGGSEDPSSRRSWRRSGPAPVPADGGL